MNQTEHFPSPLISFKSGSPDLLTVGGKSANLVKLVQLNFRVPNGFIVPTSEYQDFITANQLQQHIRKVLETTDQNSPDSLEKASSKIRAEFSGGKLSPEFEDALIQGWKLLGSGPVAVRSSATAEDLPDKSFAGQQDTFLNIIGKEALIQSTINCWSSLWTARAIGYRKRNNISHFEVSLSVIVQVMVESQSSGVMFTANPMTGLRAEIVVDSTFGLGEALVSGQVEPDNFVFDTRTNSITEKYLGKKQLALHGNPDGGLESKKTGEVGIQSIPDHVIFELVEIGKSIENAYQYPQDIEWAWANEKLYILQSRPITSLFPIPDSQELDPLQVYFSFGAVQGMLDPMTPLGQDAIRLIFAGAASLFGITDQNQHTQPVIRIAGGRLWGNTTGIIRHPIGSKIILKVFPGIDPGSVASLKNILADVAVGTGTGKFRAKTFIRLFKFGIRMFKKIFFFSQNPEDKAQKIQESYQDHIRKLDQRYPFSAQNPLSMQENISLFRELYNSFIYAVPEIFTGALAGLLPLLFLNRISKQSQGSGNLSLEITRGLPNNVTTEMDLSLWDTATLIRNNPDAYHILGALPAKDLTKLFFNSQLPEAAQSAIGDFLKRYGVRGLGEIDIGRARWRENPTQIIKTIQSYLKIEDENKAPDVVFQNSALQAQKALETLQTSVLKTHGGKLKAKLIAAAVRRLRALGGLRESPKFFIVQKMGIIRASLLATGQQLAAQGILKNHDDLFFLYLDEMEAFSRGAEGNWGQLIAERRDAFAREMLRRQVPRLLVSDGRTFYDGMTQPNGNDQTLKGSPVSPGVVEGKVRVVFNPSETTLHPGEILVCPGTDPAWTPLFLAASGLVMEVGGLMTHGAIVAREYGIPAVVGINKATEILQTGDLIRVNGSTGLVEKVSSPSGLDRPLR